MDTVWLNEAFGSVTLVAIGAIVGFLLKELLFPTLFETWKLEQSLQQVYRKYRDPLFLSGSDLAGRLFEICEDYPTGFLDSSILKQTVSKAVSIANDDPYYLHYKLTSSIYRFCAFLGWLELYRQEISFLDSGKLSRNEKIESAMVNIRSVIADGHLNEANDWQRWADHLLFREELRAIGEAITFFDEDKKRCVAGYARFTDIYFSNTDPTKKKWFDVAARFLLDQPPTTTLNFRLVRLEMLLIYLTELLELLDDKRVPKYLKARHALKVHNVPRVRPPR